MRKPSNPNRDYKDVERTDMLPLKKKDMYDNALATMDNLVARATTKWSLKESQLFICALSQIRTRDERGFVKLPKAQTMKMLGIDSKNTDQIKSLVRGIMEKSFFDFGDNNEWEMGWLVTNSKSDRWNIYIKFNSEYYPLLENLSKKFTSVYVESMTCLSHKSSYNLYLYLMSWADSNFMVQNKKIPKGEIQKIFNLKDGQYWRNWGTPKAKFDWPYFEKRCLIPAIEDINSQKGKSEIYIDSWEKVKDGKYVLGYDFHYFLIDENGNVQ